MEVIVGKTAGFCGGVLRTIQKSSEYLSKYGKVYCLGEIVHNQHVVDKLEKDGLVLIDSLDNVKNDRVIIRAHGISREVYELANKNNITLLDLTCPNVLKIHDIVSSYASNDFFIVLVCKPNHPEAIGTLGFCGKDYLAIDDISKVDDAIDIIKSCGKNKVLIISQTTFAEDKFKEISKAFNCRLKGYNVEIINTICPSTHTRQNETKVIASSVDMMIIIGDTNSSNSYKLYEIAKANCDNSYLIQDLDDLLNNNIDYSSVLKVGVMAGASTPIDLINEVVNYLKKENI